MARSSFQDRIRLTKLFDDLLVPFLRAQGVHATQYGWPAIFRTRGTGFFPEQAQAIATALRDLRAKRFPAALAMKYTPDFIVLGPSGYPPFLLDSKVSVTPVFLDRQVQKIRETSGRPALERCDIAEIEREALDVYQQHYPTQRVAICVACPYHPRLVVAEWASNVEPLYRLPEDRNLRSTGSGTPHVNIDLSRMRTLQEFLTQEFAIAVDQERYAAILARVRGWPLSYPDKIGPTEIRAAVDDLRRTCEWLAYETRGAISPDSPIRRFNL